MLFMFEMRLRGVEGKPVGRGKLPRRRVSTNGAWCFSLRRRVRHWALFACAGFLKIFGHGTVGLDP